MYALTVVIVGDTYTRGKLHQETERRIDRCAGCSEFISASMITIRNSAGSTRLCTSLTVEPLEDMGSMSAMPAGLAKDEGIVNAVSHRRIIMCELSVARGVRYNAQRHQTH